MIIQNRNDLTVEEALQLMKLGRVIMATDGKLKTMEDGFPGEHDTTAIKLLRTRPPRARRQNRRSPNRDVLSVRQGSRAFLQASE